MSSTRPVILKTRTPTEACSPSKQFGVRIQRFRAPLDRVIDGGACVPRVVSLVLAFCLFAVASLASCAMGVRDMELPTLMGAASPTAGAVLGAPEQFRVQVLVSEVSNGTEGRTRLVRNGYRVDAEYFYPASAIKLCAAVAALRKIEDARERHGGGDLLDATMVIGPLSASETAQAADESNLDGGRITVGHEIRKLALVSDNQAFNRLYDLVGHEELNARMHALGLGSAVINHRLSETRPIADQRATAEVRLRTPDGRAITIPAQAGTGTYTNAERPGLLVGNGHKRGDELVGEPMDFTGRNGISLVDLQDLLVKVARPDIQLRTPGLRLSDEHREWLLRAMTEYPRESRNPVYPEAEYPDEFCKFLLPGVRRVLPSAVPGERVEITGKIGQAYGFTIENSYLVNPASGRAVFVTAVIYTNADGILNDDTYEYATVAEPFLADLGELVARRWLLDTSR